MGGFDVLFYLAFGIALVGTSSSDYNKTGTEDRQGRVNGYMMKVYSGTKMDPVMCPKEGFLGDPDDCSLFYRCVKSFNGKYTVHKFKCSPGTVYDPETEICNHAGNTKRTECGGKQIDSNKNSENEIDDTQELPTPITKLPLSLHSTHDETVRDKYPTSVSETVPSENYPATSTIKNFVAQESTYAHLIPSTKKPDSKITLSSNLRTTSSPKINTSKEITIMPNLQKGEECTKEGFMGDSENCRKFYRCVSNNHRGFIRYEFLCSDVSIWDEDIQSCNHPWAVRRRRCGKSNDNNYSTQNNDFLDNNVLSPSESTYGNKVAEPEKEITDKNVGQNKPPIHREDNYLLRPDFVEISYFSNQVTHSPVFEKTTTVSTSNTPQLQTTDGYFNQFTQPPLFTHSDVQTITNLYNKGETGLNIQSLFGSDCYENGFMGDINDCRKFYRCIGNGRGRFIKYEFTCSQGTVWDSNLDACNYAWAVKDCGRKKQSTSDKTDIDRATAPTFVGNLQPMAETTELHFASGNQYNNLEKHTTTTLVPIEKNNLGNDCSTTGFFGNTNDCQTFFRCIDNGHGKFIKYTYKCDEGTFWDPSTQSCNYKDKATSCHIVLLSNKTTLLHVNTDKMSTIPFALPSTEKNHQSNVAETVYSKNNSLTHIDPYKPIHPHTYTSTKTPVNKNNVCQSSGFIGDIDDCKTFYRCVDDGNGNFIQHSFLCGEGTVWDPSIEACNHASAVPKCGGSSTTSKDTIMNSITPPYTEKEDSYFTQNNHQTPNTHSTLKDLTTQQTTTRRTIETTSSTTKNQCTKSGFRGDSKDCSKFYRCVDNGNGVYTQYEFSCGDDTVWDSSINACNHKWAVKECNSTKEVPKQNVVPTIKDNVQSSSSLSVFQTTKQYYATTSRVTSHSESSIALLSLDTYNCESEGFHADQNDCSRFYRCVNNGKDGYTKYDFTCGEGTTWNQKIQACDHKNSSDCSLSNTKPENYPVEKTTHAIVQEQVTETTQEKEIIDFDAQNGCNSEGFFANPKECSKFYRCVGDGKGSFIKYEFSCGKGTIWVQENQVCDHDTGITNCSISSTVTESISSNVNPTSIHITTTSVPKSTTQEQHVENNIKKCDSEGYYPHENNCKKFYRCVNEGDSKYTRYDYTCGEGTAWDVNIQSCNHINEVKRCETEQTSSTSTEALPVLQDEQAYSETNHNVGTSKQPLSTTQSNNYEDSTKPSRASTKTEKTTRTNEHQHSSTESSKPKKQDDCKEGGYFGSSSNCKKFYRCVSNQDGEYTKYDFTCGEGTIWDQSILGCNHPENVVNASCKSTDSNEMTNASSSSTSESSNNQESSGTSTSSQSTSTQSITESSGSSDNKPDNNTYICTEAGFYADPNDCKMFYRCVDWDNTGERFSIFHFVCGEGTLWDQSLLTCNHEHSVNCSSSQQQSQNTTEETSIDTSTEPYTSTTTESSITQTSTSRKPTTDKTTTQKSTTRSSTTEKSTTQASTTGQSTTQTSTTEQLTTQASTTQEPTTKESTTQESATQQSTTTTTTTEQSSTSQASTEESVTAASSSSEKTTSGTTEQSTSSTTAETTTQDQTTASEQTTKQEISSTTNTAEQTTQTDKTTTQSSTESSTTDQIESTTETSSTSKECPETNDGEYLFVCPTSFRRHPKYCNLFYQCSEDDDTHESKIATFHCPNNTIYDESKVQCVEEKKAHKKCDGEIASRRRVKRLGYNYKDPITVGKEKMDCKMAGYHLFEKNEECSPAFLKCESATKNKLRGYVYKCPEGYLYWKISKRCEASKKIKDCKRSSFDWSGRNEIPIEKLNVAP